jgi:hypothetical protein
MTGVGEEDSMVKLSWQVTIIICVAMAICGAVIITSYFVEGADEMRQYAWVLFASLVGFGGGKLQTTWEIRKMNGGSHGGSTQPDP